MVQDSELVVLSGFAQINGGKPSPPAFLGALQKSRVAPILLPNGFAFPALRKTAARGYDRGTTTRHGPESLHARIRELTEECRRLRKELVTSTNDRIASNAMANDIPMPSRRTRQRLKKE